MSSPQAASVARRIASWAVRVGPPLAVFAVVLAVFLGERMSIDHELSLAIPDAVAPGAAMPARALVFDRLEMPDGPRLVSAPVELSLVDRSGAALASATLEPSPAGGADGSIAIPAGPSGWIEVVAIARVDGEPVASVRTSVEVTRHPAQLAPQDRIAGDLQRLELGPVEGPSPPHALDVRVVGGACVPEERCEVLVHVGEPAAAVALAPAASLDVEAPSPAPTSGLTRFVVTVHGPEARTELVATRDGAEVARRRVQLPVALATPALELSPRVSSEPRVRASVLGDRPALLVEAFRDGHWARTASMATTERAVALPFALEPGLWTIEVHTDPFSAERSAVRVVGVPGHPSVEAFARGAPPGADELRFAWAAATYEASVLPVPEGVSGRVDDLARLEARQRVLRIAAGVALLLGLVLAAVLLMLRGLEAAQQAQEVMEATGDPELASARHRRRTFLSALAIVAFALLAFLGAAILIVARAHLLG